MGARIKVVYAGACYRRNRSASMASTSIQSANSFGSGAYTAASIELTQNLMALKAAILSGTSHSDSAMAPPSPSSHHGVRDGALFPGFEVAGVIDELGTDIVGHTPFTIGQRICLYPFDETPDGYAEYIVVPDLQYLVPVPKQLSLAVAAMLPTGALLAWSTVLRAHQHVTDVAVKRAAANLCEAPVKILIVGTGGLAMWAVRIAAHHFQSKESSSNEVAITIASLRDEGFELAKDLPK